MSVIIPTSNLEPTSRNKSVQRTVRLRLFATEIGRVRRNFSWNLLRKMWSRGPENGFGNALNEE
ncbi:predicted protein [Sclerotinia sclerotiorum 1980 UF-70]|uniref:Uncharacterized protein n=1 Tax=Sclerotinia sclerotiorum (strain ATCC 18683 / 1980 / Ss-1) TaxID=665079 RepID=A7F010_SCLS1|nr:predicted protein [Sclerotinia sclerotiorum 1980 UF-70]EDN95052.1 predicted protein [Sclerotinia sclerotiorum 1980 UF-70]